MHRKHSVILLLVTVLAISLEAKDYSVTSFGAEGDGSTLNTVYIQKAIDMAHSEGGGRVVFPKGKFLSGTIILKSNVELHLKRGAVLLGSTQFKDYQKLKRWRALVMADSAENIAITGKGTLDGQGCELALHIDSLCHAGALRERWYDKKEKRPVPDIRPQIIEFWRSKNIKVTGVNILNAASWVQTYDLCENLVIDRIKVVSNAFWNNDGMDIVDCKNVSITNCYVDAADDGICIKSWYHAYGLKGTCENIFVSNCKVRSSASAVKLGTSSYGGFKNVTITNIKVFDTYRSAIALEIWEGGDMENVLVSNVKAVNTGNAIFIRLGQKDFLDLEPGTLKNVKISDVKVKIAKGRPDADYPLPGPALPFFHNIFPASISGIPGHPVENITLENIKIIYPGGGNACYARMPLYRAKDVPEKIEDYPEFSMFGELPAWAFYFRHVNGLTLKNVTVKAKNQDYRPAFVLDDIQNLVVEGLTIKGDDKPQSFIELLQNSGK